MVSKLGGLPELSYGPATLQPAPVVSGDATVDAFAHLADQAEGLVKDVFRPDAEAEGSNAVTKDANGNLTVAAPSLKTVLTGQTEAYQHAAQLSYITQSALDIRPKIADLKNAYADNPDGFRAALDKYTGSVLTATPQSYQPAIRQMIDTDGGAALTDLTNDKNKKTADDAKENGLNLWQQSVNTLSGYARSNDLNNPVAQKLLAQTKDLQVSLTNNPVIKLSREEQLKFATLESTLKAQTFAAQGEDLYHRYGEAEAETQLKGLVNDPSLNLSDDERQTAMARGLSEIRFQASLDRENNQEAQRQVEYQADDAKAQALATGDYSSVMTDQQIRAAYAKNPQRAEQIIEGLHGAAETYTMKKSVAMASPADLASLAAKYNPANQSTIVPTSTGSRAGDNLANNNPGNMKVPGSDTQFQQFPSMQEGIDAVGHQINLYRSRDGLNTIADIVSKYAPPMSKGKPENNTAAYISDVANATGIPANQPLTDAQVPAVRDAIIRHEQGGTTPDDLLAGPQHGPMGSDFAARQRTYQAFQTAVQARQKALMSDPQNYVLQNRPDIVAQVNSTDPQTAQNGVRASLAVQSDLGVAQPQVLANGQKQAIIANFTNPPDPAQRAQNMLTALGGLQAKYGKYYPQVMAELAKGGKMPAEVTGLDWVRQDPGVGARMANAVNTGKSALAKLVPDTGDVDKAVVQGLAGFNGTLRGFDGSQIASQMVQATQLYAYQLVAEGTDPATAASQAVNDIVGKNFHVQDTYRVPSYLNAGSVARGVSLATQNLHAVNLEPYAGATGVSVGDRQKMSESILKSQGVWLTLPDNSGVALAWPAQTGYLQARTSKGQPIQYTWAQLSSMEKGQPIPINTIQDQPPPPGTRTFLK